MNLSAQRHEQIHRLNKRESVALGLDRNSLSPAFDPPFAATSCKNCYNGAESDFVTVLQLSVSDKNAIDLCPVRWVQILQVVGVADFQEQRVLCWYSWMINDNVVRRGTANEDKVATQLMRWEITSFVTQNQPSHLTSNLAEKFAFSRCRPPLRNRCYNDYISSRSTLMMDKISQHEKRGVSGVGAGFLLSIPKGERSGPRMHTATGSGSLYALMKSWPRFWNLKRRFGFPAIWSDEQARFFPNSAFAKQIWDGRRTLLPVVVFSLFRPAIAELTNREKKESILWKRQSFRSKY
jgi:hypothetical protein